MMTQNTNSTKLRVSTTNFDLPSVYLLREEIDAALKDAEVHLGEYNDDDEQAPLLLDSAQVIAQLASVFSLISFKGASELSSALSQCLQKLYDSRNDGDKNVDLIMDISEAIMILDRYIEFVLLKEILAPSLLLPIINKLYAHLGKAPLADGHLRSNGNISINDPEANYQSLKSLDLDDHTLTTAYRAGLGVILMHQDNSHLSSDDKQKLNAMSQACNIISQHSDKLFWQAAYNATANIGDKLPLSNAQKRTLIYLEQQFQDYLPIEDRRFADLVSFAISQNPKFADIVHEQYNIGHINEDEYQQMRHFLLGPNHAVTDTLNTLIQEDITKIKDKVNALERGEALGENITSELIAEQIAALASTMKLLRLNDAYEALTRASNDVKTWQSPTSEDMDKLLMELMIAENASIFMAKTHTPGAIKLPLHNRTISLHRLDTAYEVLIKESLINVLNTQQAIIDYLADPNRDLLNLQNTPEMLTQVAGAVNFLRMQDIAKMVARLAKYLQEVVIDGQQTPTEQTLANIADIIVALEYYLTNFEADRPTSKQPLLIGRHSLNRVLAAA